jgi:hypothetical protein
MPKSPAESIARLPDPTRVRWTRDEARAVVTAYEASGLSLENFAERESLKPLRVARWQRKLKAGKPPAAPKFVELRPAPARRPSQVELVLRSGHVLFIGESFDPASLERILEILERDSGC